MTDDAGQATAPATWADVSRAVRTLFGLAQEDWGAWMDVSRKTVQRWERGTAAPDNRVEARLIEFCRERSVFERARRAGTSIGVGSIDELCDVVSSARRVRVTRGEPPPAAALDRAGLFGRADSLADLHRLLGEHRLVTVTGAGGVGKTALARAARPPGTRVLVELATVRDPELVLGEIAEHVGVREHGGRTVRDAVVHRINGIATSLVLDNLEHLPQAFPIVDDLLASCPRLRILATSRTPLGLRGEVELRLSPLGFDDTDSASVALFLHRARRADPAIRFGPPEMDLVVEVCARLDGLPLAIELGAARLRSIDLGDLHTRIDRPLKLLGRGPRHLPAHHQSLRDSLRWSYDLLGADPARLLLQLGCFVGGCTLDVAELLGADEALDDVATLVESSLVYRDGPRYRLLETVREFSVEVAQATGHDDELTERFTSWATSFALEHAGRMHGPNASEALAAMAREYANLREALQRLLARDDGASAHRLAAALTGYWDGRSLIGEARRSIELTLATDGAHPVQRATLLNWLAYFCTLQNDLAAAMRHALESLAVWESRGVDAGIGYARLVLGRVAAEQDRLDDAIAELATSEEHLERAGDTWGMVRPINALGEVERARGRFVAARAHHVRALAICRELGELASLPSILCDVAHVSLDLGESDAACEAAEEALAIATQLENTVGVTNALDALGRCRLAEGKPGDAVDLWAEARLLHRQLGLPVERRDQAALARDLETARAILGPDVFAEHWTTAEV